MFYPSNSTPGINNVVLSKIEEEKQIKQFLLQECIPVGYVPAGRPYAGVCFPPGGGGVPGQGGCSGGGGGCSRGVSAPGGLLPGGCLLQGGLLRGGVYSRGGIPACTEADTLPPPLWTEFLTHACKNITLGQLRCGW